MASIHASEVNKTFPDGTTAVRGADLDIADGEFFILVGPSGCGKSTLLNMIVGLEDISSGELRVGDRVVNDVDPKDRNMAMVFQSYAIYPHMSVRENMAFPLELAKVDEDEVTRRVEQTAEILELTELLERKPANLSGGQRQRVAMGRAIVREPEAFLMDEPLSNLDAKLRVQMRTEISRLQQRLGTTVVYVTHDQTEAMTLGDRVAVLRKGEIQQVDSPRGLYSDPVNLFVAGFIGSPAMNFLPGEVEGDTLHLPMADLTIPAALRERASDLTDGPVIVGIRPENIEDASLIEDALVTEGTTFRSTIDVTEWMGSDLYAYFEVQESGSDQLTAMAEELGEDLEGVDLADGDETTVVARLDIRSEAAEGEELDLWIDARALHLFDADTGDALTRRVDEEVAAHSG